MPFPLNTLPPTAHSNTIHSRHYPGSNRPPTPNPVQAAASTTDVTSVDSVAVRGYSHPKPVSIEHQRPDKCATRPTRGRPKKNPAQRQVKFPQVLSPIPPDRHAALGVGTSGASLMQPIDVENYEEQRKRGIARRLEEDDRMFEQFRQERARMAAESEARLAKVRRQANAEREH